MDTLKTPFEKAMSYTMEEKEVEAFIQSGLNSGGIEK